ncbi:lysozyme [Halomonas sp. V046]|uniref:lysozyme n=1 Tax=Halomonas sp. V046 TaxID=3459611 RepID=UPI004043F4F6
MERDLAPTTALLATRPSSPETVTRGEPAGRATPASLASFFEALDPSAVPPPNRLSPRGRRWLMRAEGLRLLPYDDATSRPLRTWNRRATIGYGHLIPRAEWSNFALGIDRAWAEALLRADLKQVERPVVRLLAMPADRRSIDGLYQHEFDALVLLGFNIGIGALGRSSALALIRDPEAKTSFATLEAAWKAWCQTRGKVMAGLVRRRAGEWRIFSQADYRWSPSTHALDTQR